MTSSIVGKALIVAWSFTLSNLGPTPQIVDLGTAPTDANYVPVQVVFVGAQEKDAEGLTFSLGTSKKTPTNVLGSYEVINKYMDQNVNGYFTFGGAGNSIIPADHDLYVEYSSPTIYPASDKPIRVDVLAYPTY